MPPISTTQTPILLEPDSQYFSWPDCWGSTDAKRFHESPQKAWDYRNGVVPSPDSAAFAFGRAWDCLTTTPHDFAKRFAVRPDGLDGRTKEGKAWLADQRAAGTETLTQDDHGRLMLMRERMPQVFADMLTGMASGISQAIVRVPGPGAWFHQCKVDVFYPKQDLMLDVKTTSDSLDRFANSSTKFGYHIQAGWYRAAWFDLTGRLPDFQFLVTETQSPFRTRLFTPDEQFYACGDRIAEELRQGITRCYETGDWSDCAPMDQTLSLPAWAN
jgi:hypothetical protein